MQVAAAQVANVAFPAAPGQSPEQQSFGLPHGLPSTPQAQAPAAQESVAQSPSASQLAPSARPGWQNGPESTVIRHMPEVHWELRWHSGKMIPQPDSIAAQMTTSAGFISLRLDLGDAVKAATLRHDRGVRR